MGKSMFSSTLYVWLDPSCMIFRYLDVNIYIYPYVYSCAVYLYVVVMHTCLHIYHIYMFISV